MSLCAAPAMEQKRVFELVVDNMLPGLDVELGAFEDILNIMATSRLGKRRLVLQWVGARYKVVGLAKFNELTRLDAQFLAVSEIEEKLQEALEGPFDYSAYLRNDFAVFVAMRDPNYLRYAVALRISDLIVRAKTPLEAWFSPRHLSRWAHRNRHLNMDTLIVGVDRRIWDKVLLFTLTKWSRLSLDE